MVYEGKALSSSERRRKRKLKAPAVNSKAGVKLVVCLWVLFIAVFIKVVFPSTAEQTKEKAIMVLGGSVDYFAAARVLGEAVEGEKGILEAISEACSYAFHITSDDVEVLAGDSSDIDDSELYYNEPVTYSDPVDSENDSVSDSADADEVTDDSGEISLTENATDEPAAVTAFKESQLIYGDLELPENTTYDMPDLSIVGECPMAGTVSSEFGYRTHPDDGQVKFHYGTDVGAALGTEVCAFADGTVAATGDSTSYGLYVILEHENNVRTLYAHLDSVAVKNGQSVSENEKIGEAGETGNATSPCLHFELIIDGVYVNPEYYVSWA